MGRIFFYRRYMFSPGVALGICKDEFKEAWHSEIIYLDQPWGFNDIVRESDACKLSGKAGSAPTAIDEKFPGA